MFSTRNAKKRHPRVATAWIVVSLIAAALVAVPEEAEVPAPRLAVVTHLDNDIAELSRAELARMFRKTQTEWADGERCIPIDQVGGSDIRSAFGRIVLRETPDEWKRYWIQQSMTGNARPPIALDSSDTVKKYVRKLRGAVAYIYLTEVDDTVRMITITDAPELAAPEPAEKTPADNDGGRTPPPADVTDGDAKPTEASK